MSLVPRQPSDELEEALAAPVAAHPGGLALTPEVVAMVRTAWDVQGVWARQEPRPAFRYAATARFEEQVRARTIRPSRGFSIWRPAALGLATLLVLLVSVVGVAAAGDAIPGEPLYPVKRLHESLQLTLADDALARAELHAEFAERRFDELRRLGGQVGEAQASALTAEMVEHREQALAASRDLSLDPGDEAAYRRLDQLRARLEHNPAMDIPPVETALKASTVLPEEKLAEPTLPIDDLDATELALVSKTAVETEVGTPDAPGADDVEAEAFPLRAEAPIAPPPLPDSGRPSSAEPVSPAGLAPPRTPTPTPQPSPVLPVVADSDPLLAPEQAPLLSTPRQAPVPTREEVSSFPVEPVADPSNRPTAPPMAPPSSNVQVAPGPSHDPDPHLTPAIEPTRRLDQPDQTPRRTPASDGGQGVRVTPTPTREPTAEPTAPRRPSPSPTATLRPPRPTLTSRPHRPPTSTTAPRLRD